MNYSYIIIPIIVLITSQALKLLADGIKGNFDIKNMLESYGGMPSSHTAFAISITTLIGLRLGINSALFAACLVFTLLIMRDAVSFRNHLGKQATAFNRFIKKLPKRDQLNMPHFQERMGHSALEVSAGAVWGIALAYLLNLL